MAENQALEGNSGHGGSVAAAARLSGRAEASIDDFSTNCFFAAAPLTERLVGETPWFSGSALLRYPDPRNERLRVMLAAREGVNPDMVIAGNGASELIWAALPALPGVRRVLFLGPLFVQYARACSALGIAWESVSCPEENFFLPDAAALERVARSGADAVIVCSPNNPGTGAIRDFSPLLKAAGGRVLLLDSSYRGFLPEEAALVHHYPELAAEAARNGGELVLLDSLTKLFCCPGVRLGFAVAGEEFIARMDACRPSWSVSAAAEAAGLVLLRHEAEYRAMLPELARDVEDVAERLERSGLFRRVLRGLSFVAAAVKDGGAAKMQEYLLRREGVMVRVCDNVPGMPEGWVRIQARPERHMQRLYAGLEHLQEACLQASASGVNPASRNIASGW